MTYSLQVIERSGAAAGLHGAPPAKPYLRFELAGPMLTSELRRGMQETLALLAERSLEALLVDIRAATTRLELGGFFFLAAEAARTPGPRPRTALLARADQRRDAEYMENSLVNRGLPFRAFLEPEDPLRWLGVTGEGGSSGS